MPASLGEWPALISRAVGWQARVDHKNGTVHFGGLEVQSDRLRDHIAALTKRLHKAATMIQPAQEPDKEARRLQVRRVTDATIVRQQ